MVDDRTSRFSMYMSLFGLQGSFTSEDLRHAYRTLAKLNHPDVNKQDTSSQMRMIIINEGYRFLSEILENDELGTFITDENNKEKNEDVDRVYSQYRRGFNILTEAFDRYYGDQKTPDEGDIHVLREKLSMAKNEFARIVTDFPYNQWVDDAIDRINSINKWLGNYQV